MPAHREGKVLDSETAEEIHRKRARGEIACAECRRLKLKCDRKIPCSACTRRGCSSICPNGSLKAGQGTRFVLTDTEHLHQKIGEMSERIRVLEDALELVFARQHPGSTHPLLKNEFLSIKNPLRRKTDDQPDEKDDKDSKRPPDAAGAISIAPDGSVQYFAGSAGTEMLFMKADPDAPDDQDAEIGAGPSKLVHEMSLSFPFWRDLGADHEATLATLKGYLPPYERGLALIDLYFDNASFYFRPMNRLDLLDFVFNPIYRDLTDNRNIPSSAMALAASSLSVSSSGSSASLHPHQLGLMFAVFAVGACVDLNLPPASKEAEQYFHFSRGAMSMRPMLEEVTFETVLALGYMSIYRSLAEKWRTMTSNHTYLSVCCLLAQNLGLHRDPARWGLSPRLVDMRRRAFWEITCIDHHQGLTSGCSPFFLPERIDCEAPIDEEQKLTDEDKIQRGYWAWRQKAGREVLSQVLAHMTNAAIPTHAKIMELDSHIREFYAPIATTYTFEEQPDEVGHWSVRMQRFQLVFAQACCLIFVHRTFFAQVCQDHPTQPTNSPFAASYLATYKSSVLILQLAKKESERHMPLLARFPHVWTQVFNAAIIVGSAIARGPNNTFASAGLIELAHGVGLFERAAQSSRRARMALPYLMTLLRKAHRAYTEYNTKGLVDPSIPDEGEGALNLKMFGGQAKVFARGGKGRSASASMGSSSNATPLTPTTSSPSPPGPQAVLEAVQSVQGMNIFGDYKSPGSRSEISPPATSPAMSWPPGGHTYVSAMGSGPGGDGSLPAIFSGNGASPSMSSPPSGGESSYNPTSFSALFGNRDLPPPHNGRGDAYGKSGESIISNAPVPNFEDLWGMSNLLGASGSIPMSTTPMEGVIGDVSGLRSEHDIHLFGLDPISGQTQADDSWATFVRDTSLFWNPNDMGVGNAR